MALDDQGSGHATLDLAHGHSDVQQRQHLAALLGAHLGQPLGGALRQGCQVSETGGPPGRVRPERPHAVQARPELCHLGLDPGQSLPVRRGVVSHQHLAGGVHPGALQALQLLLGLLDYHLVEVVLVAVADLEPLAGHRAQSVRVPEERDDLCPDGFLDHLGVHHGARAARDTDAPVTSPGAPVAVVCAVRQRHPRVVPAAPTDQPPRQFARVLRLVGLAVPVARDGSLDRLVLSLRQRRLGEQHLDGVAILRLAVLAEARVMTGPAAIGCTPPGHPGVQRRVGEHPPDDLVRPARGVTGVHTGVVQTVGHLASRQAVAHEPGVHGVDNLALALIRHRLGIAPLALQPPTERG